MNTDTWLYDSLEVKVGGGVLKLLRVTVLDAPLEEFLVHRMSECFSVDGLKDPQPARTVPPMESAPILETAASAPQAPARRPRLKLNADT